MLKPDGKENESELGLCSRTKRHSYCARTNELSQPFNILHYRKSRITCIKSYVIKFLVLHILNTENRQFNYRRSRLYKCQVALARCENSFLPLIEEGVHVGNAVPVDQSNFLSYAIHDRPRFGFERFD